MNSKTNDKYDFKAIEQKWQTYWEENKTFEAKVDSEQEKYYVLEMFPYPSGRIHMGHVRNYSIGDVIARYKRMRGYNVIHPMGWDAFGLPAENAALKRGIHPAKWTHENIAYMRKQLKEMGFSYDWDRELATCDPTYYRWEQLIFLQMYEKGIVYRKETTVNWCNSCQTVLAREQVIDGCCWRCDEAVEPRTMHGWFFKITDYAEELLADLDNLHGWPEKVVTMQKNWIGKSNGLRCDFPVDNSDKVISIFTTRPDTIHGVTFMSLAVEHPLIDELISGSEDESSIRDFIKETRLEKQRRTLTEEPEKNGIFTGRYAVNPFTGDKIPIYLANFVLMEYGTGAVMAVPAHDQRDFEFASKYKLPIIPVVEPEDNPLATETLTEAHESGGTLVSSGSFNGMNNEEAKLAIIEHAESKGFGSAHITYRLRDWGISRQRYWGAPIPIIHCEHCGIVPVAEENLPVVLPGAGNDNTSHAPLHQQEDFFTTTCPKCNEPARRETDTMDTFMESSWYFARYTSPNDSTTPIDRKAADYWLQVDQYIGGVEHAILHLLYSRFFTKVLRDLGYLNIDEPFRNLLTQGMVIKDGFKMSKSKGNVVDPNDLIESYGADTVRLFSLFAAPPERDLEWNAQGVEGASRFLNRLYRLIIGNIDCFSCTDEPDPLQITGADKELYRKVHQTIKRFTDAIEKNFHFNTAISSVQELFNLTSTLISNPKSSLNPAVLKASLETSLLLLSPMVPHFCEETWEVVGHTHAINQKGWPIYNPEAAKEDELTIIVQVNGKVRGKLQVPADIDNDSIQQQALTDERVTNFIGDKEVKKIIVVKKKLVNIVV